MNSDIESRLLQLNRAFYQSFAAPFADSRSRPRPGTLEMLDPLAATASVLDLGCGNGTLARAITERGHHGTYVGLDFSAGLLAAARASTDHPSTNFIKQDIAESGWSQPLQGPFDWVCLLAVLHHIPGRERRARLVREAAALLTDDGRMLVSAWNFSAEPGWRERVVPWSEMGLTRQDVDEGDFLLDWRRGGEGVRYVHLFAGDELEQLASANGLHAEKTHFAGGESGRLNLLQRWKS